MFVFVRKSILVYEFMYVSCEYAYLACVLCACLGVLVYIIVYVCVCLGEVRLGYC